jgi:hypothetical protein
MEYSAKIPKGLKDLVVIQTGKDRIKAISVPLARSVWQANKIIKTATALNSSCPKIDIKPIQIKQVKITRLARLK